MSTKTEALFTSIDCEDNDGLEAATALYDGVLERIHERHMAWVDERARDLLRGVAGSYCEHGARTGEPCVQCELALPPAAEAIVITERVWAEFQRRSEAVAATTIVLMAVTTPDEGVPILMRALKWVMEPVAEFAPRGEEE